MSLAAISGIDLYSTDHYWSGFLKRMVDCHHSVIAEYEEEDWTELSELTKAGRNGK